MLSGGLQLMQVYLVEILQRRIFTKAAFEFAFRIPRIRSEALLNLYPPELMNRFFDVITLQKGFSKILLDLTTAFLQIIFGLILLALYHPLFILFGLVLFSLLLLMFRITGSKALQSSIKESSRKYQIVSWFEDMARNINTFKIAFTLDTL
jgi:ABC-type bacteriocin/lantibiotic exporter with double-glycine peptidase domain